MADFKLVKDDNGFFDLDFSDGDFQQDDSLHNAVHISLLTDSRATRDEVVSGDLKGFWFDSVSGDNTGSKLWLMSRAKILDNDTVLALEGYIFDCLEWVLQQGIAKSITVRAERNKLDRERIDSEIDILKSNDTVEQFSYEINWSAS